MLYIVCLHHCMYVCYMFIKYQSIMWSIEVCNQPHCYGNLHAVWDHTVLRATLQRHFRLYLMPKLVLDLVTLELT